MSRLRKEVLHIMRLLNDDAGGGALARNSATVFLLIVLGALFGLASQIALTRTLGAAEYGHYAIAISFSLLLAALTMAGLDGSIIRFASEYIERGASAQLRKFVRFVALFQLAAVLVAAAIVAWLPVGAPEFSRLKQDAWIWIVLNVGCAAFLGSFSSFFTAFRNYVSSHLYQHLLRPALLVGCVAWAGITHYRPIDATFALKITALTSLLALLLLLLSLGCVLRRFGRVGPSELDVRRWIVFSGWVQLGNICNQALVQIPVLMLGVLAGAVQAGYYAVSVRVSSLVTIGLSAVAFAMSPMIAGAYARADIAGIARLARTSARLATAIAVLAIFVLGAGGEPLMAVFGRDFSQSYPVLMVLLVGALFNAFSGTNAILLAMTDQPRFAVEALIVGTVVNVSSSYILIPGYGALGAAIGTSIGLITSNAMMVVRVRTSLGIDSTAVGLNPRLVDLPRKSDDRL